MAPVATLFARAPSTGSMPLQSGRLTRVDGAIERVLERERDQLPLWLPVALGTGIAAWFVLDDAARWAAWIALMGAIASGALLLPRGGRLSRVILLWGLASALGCGIIWLRAMSVSAPVLTRPTIAVVTGSVEGVEVQAAKQRVRLTVLPRPDTHLPPRVRITVDQDKMPTSAVPGDRIRVRARLVGPQAASVPGGFNFSRVAWFQGLGATGKAIGSLERLTAADAEPGLRERLSAHIRSKLDGSAGGIAAAFASGDRGGIDPADEDSMRASGLTHLLSVSGLHVTAVVGAAMFLTLRLLALSRTLALRLPLLVIAALAGAAAGIGYTLLTGAEVPTVRSCVAAVLVLAGLAIGREAFTLRLVATGAMVVLLIRPEAMVGPSFQLSFAAIASIVALHEVPWVRALGQRGEHGRAKRLARSILVLLLTGLVVELALSPIAFFHFHKSGVFGALANIIAIPLTTFVIMPLEALALLFDVIGFGAPFWWATGLSLHALLVLSHFVAGLPGAQTALASIPEGAFALMIGGGLWLILWRTRMRLLGIGPIVAGIVWALTIPPPDLLVTGDGMHIALRADDGRLATLRPRAGDYIRSVLSERAGVMGDLDDLDDLPEAACSTDLCRVAMSRGDRVWTVLATRSGYTVERAAMAAQCARADIVVSDRRLPGWCRPRWFKADRALLSKTGGLAITFADTRVETVAESEGAHPWVMRTADARKKFRRPSGNAATGPPAYPAR